MDANNESLSGYLEVGEGNEGGIKPSNDTKMSDNEAFMAYMSKAETYDDDDE